MKRVLTLYVVCLMSFFMATTALANDEDDVKAAAEAVLAAFRNWDAVAWANYHMPGTSRFSNNGRLLNETFDADASKIGFAQAKSSGASWNAQWRHLSVKVIGNTAVSTGYMVGTFTMGNGQVNPINIRNSVVWVKQGGQWKMVHYHNSDIKTPASQ